MFVANSTNTKAIRVTDNDTICLQIQLTESGFALSIRLDSMHIPEFEVDDSLEGIQTKAQMFMDAIEGE